MFPITAEAGLFTGHPFSWQKAQCWSTFRNTGWI